MFKKSNIMNVPFLGGGGVMLIRLWHTERDLKLKTSYSDSGDLKSEMRCNEAIRYNITKMITYALSIYQNEL